MSTTITGIVTNGVVVPDSALPEGSRVEIHLIAVGVRSRMSMLESLETLPSGPSPRCYPTWEEYERHLQEEKNAWER